MIDMYNIVLIQFSLNDYDVLSVESLILRMNYEAIKRSINLNELIIQYLSSGHIFI